MGVGSLIVMLRRSSYVTNLYAIGMRDPVFERRNEGS